MVRILLLLGCAFLVTASGMEQKPPAASLELLTACFSDRLHDPEWIFVVGPIAYRSFDALIEGIEKLPEGITLKWSPSDVRIGKEPLSKAEDIERLKNACTKRGITLVIVPAG